jgi:hypothetical protein
MYPGSNKPFIFDLESIIEYIQWNFTMTQMH